MKAATGFTFIHKIDLHVYFVTLVYAVQNDIFAPSFQPNSRCNQIAYIFNARSKTKYLILNNKGMLLNNWKNNS